MSDIMTCMPFGQLMEWVLQEKKRERYSIWGTSPIYNKCRS